MSWTLSGKVTNVKEVVDHIYLTAYLENGQTLRQAGDSIRVPKSTMHDWVRKHQDMIRAAQGLPVLLPMSYQEMELRVCASQI